MTGLGGSLLLLWVVMGENRPATSPRWLVVMVVGGNERERMDDEP
jgi:hypothetical protein